MNNLTIRQRTILKAIIDRFIDTNLAVSSFDLLNNSSIQVSSATIRNEMALLMDLGLVVKAYSSSGRVPTGKGIRFYINNLMHEQELKSQDLEPLSEQIFAVRREHNKFLRESMKILSQLSGEATLIYYQGTVQFYRIAKLLEDQDSFSPHLRDHYREGLVQFLDLIEDPETVKNYFCRMQNFLRKNVCVFLADENPFYENIENFTLVFSPFHLTHTANKHSCFIGAVGYSNMDYRRVVPALEYISNILNTVLKI